MRILHVVLLTLLMLVLVACNAEQTNTTIANDVSIEIAVEPDPPTMGESVLVVTVMDKEGNPIEGATVAVHGDMDHEGMTPSDGEISIGSEGIYRVPFVWSMGGGWILDVSVTLPNNVGVATKQFEVFVGAISENSIINQGDADTAEMDQSAMDDMDTAEMDQSDMEDMDHSDYNDADHIEHMEDMDHSGMDNMEVGIHIHYMSDNSPAIAGDANVIVMVMSQDGQPIDDATIALTANMSGHGMMPVTGTSSEGVDGHYTIAVYWTMAGEWDVELTVTLPDAQELKQTYTQQIIMPEDSEIEMDEMPEHNDSGS